MQFWQAVAPVTATNLPAGHLVHVLASAVSEYVPAEHTVWEVEPTPQALPAVHEVHSASVESVVLLP